VSNFLSLYGVQILAGLAAGLIFHIFLHTYWPFKVEPSTNKTPRGDYSVVGDFIGGGMGCMSLMGMIIVVLTVGITAIIAGSMSSHLALAVSFLVGSLAGFLLPLR